MKRLEFAFEINWPLTHHQEKVPKQQGSWSNSRSDEGHAHLKSQKAFKNAQFDSDDSPWSPVTKAAVHNWFVISNLLLHNLLNLNSLYKNTYIHDNALNIAQFFTSMIFKRAWQMSKGFKRGDI